MDRFKGGSKFKQVCLIKKISKAAEYGLEKSPGSRPTSHRYLPLRTSKSATNGIRSNKESRPGTARYTQMSKPKGVQVALSYRHHEAALLSSKVSTAQKSILDKGSPRTLDLRSLSMKPGQASPAIINSTLPQSQTRPKTAAVGPRQAQKHQAAVPQMNTDLQPILNILNSATQYNNIYS